jgi:hypothetical protein
MGVEEWRTANGNGLRLEVNSMICRAMLLRSGVHRPGSGLGVFLESISTGVARTAGRRL